MKRPGTAVGGPPQLPRYTHDRGLGAKARSYLEQPPMSISEPFIRRPIATSLLMLGVLVFGIGAYNLLPVAAVPNVDFPTITVTATVSRRQSQHDGVGGRHAARTAIHRDPVAEPR